MHFFALKVTTSFPSDASAFYSLKLYAQHVLQRCCNLIKSKALVQINVARRIWTDAVNGSCYRQSRYGFDEGDRYDNLGFALILVHPCALGRPFLICRLRQATKTFFQ